jgi:5-methyltetrahydropteroyltriglutamate--homocysteine methyltransferase
MELVADLTAAGYERGIGPGVWGIHPRVPAVTEMTEALSLSLALPGGRR